MKRAYQIEWIKFGFRILVLVAVVVLAFTGAVEWSGNNSVLEGMNFFRHFSVLHVLWLLYAWYMLEKLLPISIIKPRGSRKYLKSEFSPTKEYEAWLAEGAPKTEESPFWQKYQKEQKNYRKGALLVLGAWLFGVLLIVSIRLLQKQQILDYQIFGNRELLILSVLFYVGDLVCILIWCPFRDIFMKNQCCTQCRVYNWDTMMLIVPLLFIKGFYSYSLLAGAVLVVGLWEWNHCFHRERFYPTTNACLQCGNCQGELGCKRLRNK